MSVDWEQVLSAAAVLRDAAADIDHTMGKGDPGDVTLSELARLMMVLDTTQDVLSHAHSQAHSLANELMEDNEQVVPDVAVLVRNWSRSRSDWDSDQLLRDLMRNMRDTVTPAAVDPDTGERVHTWEQAVNALRKGYGLKGYHASITTIREHGLDVGDYSTQGPWRPKITVQPIERVEEANE